MSSTILLADSGATKTEWCLLKNGKKRILFTQGISPYFFDQEKVANLLRNELLAGLPSAVKTGQIFYYGTGMRNPKNVKMIKGALKMVFPEAGIQVYDDLLAAARALNGKDRGMACNLGTGSFCCFYNGKRITRQSPGIGYILGDEGSGAYLGKKVLQYFLYQTFDEDLQYRFTSKYDTTAVEIFEQVYRKPLANRYLASYAAFLSENRGHFMIENIIEDGLNDFFFHHLCKYREVWSYPVSFVGGVAFAFRDVIESLCHSYEFELGRVLKSPMEGLISFHRQ